jgi:hypothetical protein
MDVKLDTKILSPEDRAKKLVSYLEERVCLPEDVLKDIHLEALKESIEEVFRTSEDVLNNIKE